MKKKQISIKDIELIFEGKRISLNLFSCDKRKTKQQREKKLPMNDFPMSYQLQYLITLPITF